VSIVTACRNPDLTFPDTVSTVLDQSLQDWEWIIVNDASSEASSLAILADCRRRDPRIRVLDHDSPRGMAAALTTGHQAASAPYIAELGAGDLLEPTALEIWLWFLFSHTDVGFVSSFAVALGRGPRLVDFTIEEASSYRRGLATEDGPARAAGSEEARETAVGARVGLLRRRVWDSIGRFDGAVGEQWDGPGFWLGCMQLGHAGATVPQYLYWTPQCATWGDLLRAWPILDSPSADVVHHGAIQDTWSGARPSDWLRDDLPLTNSLRKEQPRLLVLGPWLTVGGAEMFNLDVIRQAQVRGWDVTVATTIRGKHEWLPEFLRLTPDVFALPRFLMAEDYARFIRYLIVSRQIDVVLVTTSEFAYDVLPYLRTRCPDVALMDVCHIETEDWKGGGFPQISVNRQELLDLTVVTTAHLKEWMAKHGSDPSRVHVCYSNVDAQEWAPDLVRRAELRRELGIAEAVPAILYSARICPQKQPDVLIRTLERLRDSNLSFRGLVVGDGPDAERLAAYSAGHGLTSHVQMLGTVSLRRLRDLMVASDIFFLPTVWEGISVAVFEAMACALPVVTAAVGGQPEVVDAETGVLIQPSGPDAEVDAYVHALTDLIDLPARRAELGSAGRRKIVSAFSLEQMGDRMVSLFQLAQARRAANATTLVTFQTGTAAAVQAIESEILRDHVFALDEAKVWLSAQLKRWEQNSHERDGAIADLRGWVANVEGTNAWLEDQRASWERVAREQEQTIAELRRWIDQLQNTNTWLESQRADWERTARKGAHPR